MKPQFLVGTCRSFKRPSCKISLAGMRDRCAILRLKTEGDLIPCMYRNYLAFPMGRCREGSISYPVRAEMYMESRTLSRVRILSTFTRVASFAACSLTGGRSATDSTPVCTRGIGGVWCIRSGSQAYRSRVRMSSQPKYLSFAGLLVEYII